MNTRQFQPGMTVDSRTDLDAATQQIAAAERPLLVRYITTGTDVYDENDKLVGRINVTTGLALVANDEELVERFGDSEIYSHAFVLAQGAEVSDFLKRVQIAPSEHRSLLDALRFALRLTNDPSATMALIASHLNAALAKAGAL